MEKLSALKMRELELQVELANIEYDEKFFTNYNKYCHVVHREPLSEYAIEHGLDDCKKRRIHYKYILNCVKSEKDDGSFFFIPDLHVIYNMNKHPKMYNSIERRYYRFLFQETKSYTGLIYVEENHAMFHKLDELDYVLPFTFEPEDEYDTEAYVEDLEYAEFPPSNIMIMKRTGDTK
jgi:hypothetical protein